MFRLLIATLFIALFTALPGCDKADAEGTRSAVAKPVKKAEPVSWELTPVDSLPDDIKGLWKADAYTVKRLFGGEIDYADALEYAEDMSLDVYPFNVNFKGVFGAAADVRITNWFVTPNQVYVGRGTTELPWEGKVEVTVYLRIHRNRLEAAILTDDERPDWEDHYTFARGK
jgi:hypothetical protein